MAKARVSLLDKPQGNFVIREFEVPQPAPGTMLMKVEYCGVCGTDVHTWQSLDQDLAYPISLGHEIVGIVAALGAGVCADYIGNPLKVGDRIGVIPAIHCHRCYFCTIAKTPEKCTSWKTYGTWPNADKNPLFNGGFGEYLYIHDPNSVVLKMDTSAERGVFLEPLAVLVHAVMRARMQPGDTAVVQGVGPIGLLNIALAKRCGAAKVIAIGRRNPERLRLAKTMGADHVIGLGEYPELADRTRYVFEKSANRVGADVVFNTVGAADAFKDSLAFVRNSGVVVEVGNFVDSGACPINPCKEILEKNIRIEASFDNEAEHFVRAMPYVNNENFPLTQLITHKLGLSDLQRVHEAIRRGEKLDGKDIIKALIDPWR